MLTQDKLLPLTIVGIILGSLKSYLVLNNSAKRGVERIKRFGDNTCIGAVYSWRTWLLVLSMMLLGLILRNSPVPLGLLGTIIGLIQAFAALESAAPDQRAQALAKGISIAMNTTAFGLIVAIPCMGAQMFLQAVTKKILEEIDQYSVKLENLLVSRIRAGSQ